MNSLNLKSILLVDDDEISNLFNKIFIEKINLDVEVDFFLNGKEALNMLISSKTHSRLLLPCLLLLDIKMPIMNGWQFLKDYEKRISAEVKEEIVIVMLTTSQNEGDKIKAMNNPNIKDFVQKPLSEMDLRMLISKHFSYI